VKEIAAARLLGDVRIEQIREVIFAGLVGSGMEPPEAGKLCDLWVYNRPLKETRAHRLRHRPRRDRRAGGRGRHGGAAGGRGRAPLPNGRIRFGEDGVWAIGAAAGYTPEEVNRMSLWQFCAAIGGWAKANGALPDRLNRRTPLGSRPSSRRFGPDLR
jgi:hypothetical protein